MAHAPSCLPNPARLANLRSLSANCFDWTPSWLRALGALPLLSSLNLYIEKASLPDEPSSPPLFHFAAGTLTGWPMVLPRLPVLASFKAYILPACPPLRLLLDQLPALKVGGRCIMCCQHNVAELATEMGLLMVTR